MTKIYNAPPGFEMNPVGYAAELRRTRAELAQLKVAAKQALDAMKLHADQYPHMQKGYTVDAIEALEATNHAKSQRA